MGFSVDVSVPVLTVFLQGLLSFFSPCVFPLIPLYVSYLSGGASKTEEDGRVVYRRGKVILHTLCFILGVSFAFFILGFGFTALGGFFSRNQLLFARIGGAIVFLFGLYQLGVFGAPAALARERKLPLRLERLTMSPVVALVMGFTFSFAWTPCVGPVLAGVLLMTASAATTAMGFVLIGVYTLGFVLPFLAVGLFTTSLLALFKKHRGVVKYTVKVGGVLMLVMGIMMFTGKMNSVTGYLSTLTGEPASQSAQPSPSPPQEAQPSPSPQANAVPAPDFTLTDQYGNTHTLSDYRGKTVFLNFWATWCPPCRNEMPDIQRLYESFDTQGEDALIVLGIAAPNVGGEQSQEGIVRFLADNGYTYPVLMDVGGAQFGRYGIRSYPTTFLIDREGNVFGYITGQLNEDIMRDIVAQTMDSARR